MKKVYTSLIIVFLLLLAGCGAVQADLKTATGKTESRTLSGEASSLVVESVLLYLKGENTGPRVELVSDGGAARAELSGQSDVLDKLSFSLSGDTLKLSGPGNIRFAVSEELTLSLHNYSPEKIRLSGGCRLNAGELAKPHITMDISGAASASIGKLGAEKLKIDQSGASSLTIGEAELSGGLDLHISGASSLSIKGKGTEMFAVITGASRVEAIELELQKTTLTVAGASRLECFITELLGGSISGASTVYYKGDPELATSVGSSSSLQKK